MDSNNQQIDRIGTEAHTHDARDFPITWPVTDANVANVAIVIDSIHVLEYPPEAAWSYRKEGDTAAETWVREHATTVLAGKATRVAGVIPTRRHQGRTWTHNGGPAPTPRAPADPVRRRSRFPIPDPVSV